MIFNATGGVVSYYRNGSMKCIEKNSNKDPFNEFEFSALLVSYYEIIKLKTKTKTSFQKQWIVILPKKHRSYI